ncbi:arsenite efflux ATP-binding protein ArsA [Williamsia limnetica]|uniref:Arsenite efflux ATP-binding protein ArsA n=1 Tax=Williamsia limnetica TaxID=882452 RepID=A0A318RF22_WILLI|nr:ArsA-related P-loop ATPase [Williamsia limnetica]PYE15348.1 arsenite efflux ATP-binding protein ArsA [Williamsia limnetica]
MLGAGGAGTTTVAAAGAVGDRTTGRSGRSGKTLLVTLDRFHSAASVFGVFSVPGEPIPASQQVDLLELDPMAMLEETWGTVRSALTTGELTGTGVPGVGAVLAGLDPEEVLGMPGVESLLALRRIRDEAASGSWSRVVVDTSGATDPFELLRVPQMVSDTVERLWPRHRRLAASADNARIARVVAVLDALVRDCADVDELLFDTSGVDVHLVVGADRHGVATAERAVAVLQVLGLPLSTVLANRVLPKGASSPASVADPTGRTSWWDEQLAIQAGAVEQLRDIASDAELISLPWLSEPLDSVLSLRRLGVRIESRPMDTVGPQAAEVERESGSGVESVYRMSWKQALPDPSGLQLGRSGDDLMITVSGVRRRVRLPSVLRRCLVLGAQWDGGVLTVRFRPDPSVWPQP